MSSMTSNAFSSVHTFDRADSHVMSGSQSEATSANFDFLGSKNTTKFQRERTLEEKERNFGRELGKENAFLGKGGQGRRSTINSTHLPETSTHTLKPSNTNTNTTHTTQVGQPTHTDTHKLTELILVELELAEVEFSRLARRRAEYVKQCGPAADSFRQRLQEEDIHIYLFFVI